MSSDDKVVRGWAWPSAFEAGRENQGGIGLASSQIHPMMVPVVVCPAEKWEGRISREAVKEAIAETMIEWGWNHEVQHALADLRASLGMKETP